MAQSGGSYDFFGLKLSKGTVNKIVLLFIFMVVVLLFWNKIVGLFTTAKTTLELGKPSQGDFDNAAAIQEKIGVIWTDWQSSSEIADIVLTYTKENYPLLASAYFRSFATNLTPLLKKELWKADLGKISYIISS